RDQMVDQTLSGHDTIGKTKIDRLRGSDHQPNPKVRKIFDTTFQAASPSFLQIANSLTKFEKCLRKAKMPSFAMILFADFSNSTGSIKSCVSTFRKGSINLAAFSALVSIPKCLEKRIGLDIRANIPPQKNRVPSEIAR
ncbi:hypothetical protein AAFN47_08070, partial [Hoeflea sp. CAU 1731]